MIDQIEMPEADVERPSALRAIRRYWYLVLICAVLGAACGAVYAFKRPPVYTATARMSALSVNASNAAALAGSLEAAQELASTFARVVQTTEVTNAVASALHTTPAWAAANVSGSPVPSSPFVAINATASSPGVATSAANAALKALSIYANRLLGSQSSSTSLLDSIHAYALALTRAQNALGHLKGQAQRQLQSQSLTQAGTSTGPTVDPALQRQIDDATAKVAQEQTRLNGAQSAYTMQAENQLTARQAVALSPASAASNDRKQVAQVAVLLGLMIGVLLGVASAAGLASAAWRRA